MESPRPLLEDLVAQRTSELAAANESLRREIAENKKAESLRNLQHAVVEVLADAGTLAETQSRTLETICKHTQCRVGELWLADRSKRVLRLACEWHDPSDDLQGFIDASRTFIVTAGDGLSGQVWDTGKPHWCADVSSESGFRRRSLPGAAGLRGWVGVPVTVRREVMGVLGIFSAGIQHRDEALLATLSALGVQLGQFFDRQQLADQFRQAQKLEALGTLAGGIAHDFNNLLSGISGFTELAKMRAPEDPILIEYLDSVLVASKRATRLVRQILTFSRRQDSERRPIRLNSVISEALALLRASVPSTIEFDVSLEEDVSEVVADSTQIHQVMMNLCANAAHAMRGKPGRLTVRLEQVDVGQDMVAAIPDLRIGQNVRLSIGDNGCGMSPEVMSHLFEPFFTTKAPGEGTGLGLSVVHGIVRSHGGAIAVYSHPGDGTLFRLYFPARSAAPMLATGQRQDTVSYIRSGASLTPPQPVHRDVHDRGREKSEHL